MIRIKSLSKSYREFKVLDNIDLSIKNGEFVSILGPFGCGKTTLIKILGGLIADYQGIVEIDDIKPTKILKKRKIGFCFQRANLLPWRNVVENISLPLELTGDKKSLQKSIKLLKMVGLESISLKNVWEISGGTQQLVSILRSLALKPNILLLDEPFSSIDEINRGKLHTKLIKMHNKTKQTIIMITHSVDEAIFLSNRIIVLTKNPARIKKIINIDLSSRDESIKNSQAYVSYMKQIRTLLKG